MEVYVLDANAFDVLADESWRRAFLAELVEEGVIRLVTNDVIRGELEATPDMLKRGRMSWLETETAPTPFTWGVPGRGWGEGVWAGDDEIAAIGAVRNGDRHDADALLLGLAVRLNAVLVTSDKRLRGIAARQGVEVLHGEELLRLHRLDGTGLG